MIISPELQNRINTWRQKAAAGTLTIEEMREAVAFMRADRRSAAEAAGKSKSSGPRKTGQTMSATDMLNQLDSL